MYDSYFLKCDILKIDRHTKLLVIVVYELFNYKIVL